MDCESGCGCGCDTPKAPAPANDILRMRLVEIPGSDEQIDVKIEFVKKVTGDEALKGMSAAIRGMVQGAHKFGSAMGLSTDEINEVLFGKDAGECDDPKIEKIDEESFDNDN